MDELAQLLKILINTPAFVLSQIITFILLCSRLKNNILLLYPSKQQPASTPSHLPNETRIFLQRSCSMSDKDVEACYDVLKDVIWQEDKMLGQVKDERAVQETFSNHGGALYCVYTFRLLKS
jgi:hypothetical protein